MDQHQEPPQKKAFDPTKWKPGKYKARPLDWAVTKTVAGLPQVSVLFQYEQPGEMPETKEQRELIWFGSFKGRALERTLETLTMLGLKQPPYPAMETGRDGKALDEKAEVEIVVEHRADDKGNMRVGISWVNRIGGRGLESKLSQGEGSAIFAEANQAFLAFAQQQGIKVAQPAAKPGTATALTPGGQASFNEDDIPF